MLIACHYLGIQMNGMLNMIVYNCTVCPLCCYSNRWYALYAGVQLDGVASRMVFSWVVSTIMVFNWTVFTLIVHVGANGHYAANLLAGMSTKPLCKTLNMLSSK
jgi:hypothetical protein